jgi:hypothetical protein
MMLEQGTALTVALAMVGGVVWLVRLEGRINNHDATHAEHVSRHTQIREEIERRHHELRADIVYIRERIDKALNGKH